MGWLRCRLSFFLLRSAVLCIRGAHSSLGRAATSVSLPVDLVTSESQVTHELTLQHHSLSILHLSVSHSSCYFCLYLTSVPFINPRRTCAARVTVVVLCVCLCVCLQLFSHYRLRGGLHERYQQLQCYKGKKNNVAILLKRLRLRDMV